MTFDELAHEVLNAVLAQKHHLEHMLNLSSAEAQALTQAECEQHNNRTYELEARLLAALTMYEIAKTQGMDAAMLWKLANV